MQHTAGNIFFKNPVLCYKLNHKQKIYVIDFHFFQLSDYDFDVISVGKCPMSKEEWEISSARLNCNDMSEYHCVPNKHLNSLIEFCYPRKGILVLDGIYTRLNK